MHLLLVVRAEALDPAAARVHSKLILPQINAPINNARRHYPMRSLNKT
jgi:hypothetical protein